MPENDDRMTPPPPQFLGNCRWLTTLEPDRGNELFVQRHFEPRGSCGTHTAYHHPRARWIFSLVFSSSHCTRIVKLEFFSRSKHAHHKS